MKPEIDLKARIEQRIHKLMADSEAHSRPFSSAEMHDYFQSLKTAARQIGATPPGPAGLRSRVGEILIGVMQRALFWLIPPIRSSLLDSIVAVERLGLSQEDIRVQLTTQIANAQNAAVPRTASEMARLEKEMARLEKEVSRLETECNRLKRDSVEQSRRLEFVLEEARKRLPEPFDDNQLKRLSCELDHRADLLYSSFEDAFRGSRDDIKRKLAVYLPYVKDARAAGARGRILDLGCGRGEWLELLAEHEFEAAGIDTNQATAAECKARGLNVHRADVIDDLRAAPAGSVACVTAFHLLEHLDFDNLISLLDEVTRVLSPNGIFITETPNPANVLVGACNFYGDPTHRKPIPASTMAFLIEARGLCRTEVIELNPCEESNYVREGPPELVRKFNLYFYGPQDYAVIGRKP